MKLGSGDSQSIVPSGLYNEMNWNFIVWISDWKQKDYLVWKIFYFCFNLMIQNVLQNWIFFCDLMMFEMLKLSIAETFLEYANVIHLFLTCRR